jgi:MoaA/NifB/PqqE/SkfB family radical SAM enzyme
MGAEIAGVLNRNLAAYASRLWPSLVLKRPVLFQSFLYITHRCNLRCLYCRFPFQEVSELDTDQWRRVIDQLADLGVRRVTFLGGEPLLRPDLADLLRQARRRGLACVLTTNGTLVPEMTSLLRSIQTLVISLDAAGPANDEVRGEGVFAAVERAVIAARGAGIPVKINAVLSAKNATELDGLLRFVIRHDLALTVNVVRSGNDDLWREARRIKPEDEEIRKLLLDIAERAERNRRLLLSPASYRFASLWRDYSQDRYESADLDPADVLRRRAPACRAGRSYLSIDADGTAYPCVTTIGKISGGRVLEKGVEGAWRALQGHSCVACFSPCLVELNSLFSFDFRVLARFAGSYLRRYS